MTITARRLTTGDRQAARLLFALMANVFAEENRQLGDSYLDDLLGSRSFWPIAAFVNDEIVGGLTAYTLPMTKEERSELFVYDIAVSNKHRRRGVGRRLVSELRKQAAEIGIDVIFVLADDEDHRALDFYRAVGAEPSPVTMFTLASTPDRAAID